MGNLIGPATDVPDSVIVVRFQLVFPAYSSTKLSGFNSGNKFHLGMYANV